MATPKQARYIERLLSQQGKSLRDVQLTLNLPNTCSYAGALEFDHASKVIQHLITCRQEVKREEATTLPLRDLPRMALLTKATDVLGVSRPILQTATGASIIEAIEAGNDTSLLRTPSGEPCDLTGNAKKVTSEPKPKPTSTDQPAIIGGTLAEMIASAIKPHLDIVQTDTIDAVMKEVDAKLASFKPTETHIIIDKADRPSVNVGVQHECFPKLLKYLSQGMNVYLKGPAGSGKTTAGEKAAEALGLPFYVQSMGPQTSQSQLLGYMDAHGNYVKGFLYDAYVNGGVAMIDEIDNANASVVTILNSAMANGYCSFPNGMGKRHADCLFVVSGNTFGTGADALYVGRTQLDAATLDRFTIIDWPYDEAFETALVRAIVKPSAQVDKWVSLVRSVRSAAISQRVRMVVSPRATLNGAKLLSCGVEWSDVENDVLWKGISTDDKHKLQSAIR